MSSVAAPATDWLLLGIAWYIRYTCIKQMSLVIAFDIAAVAQKVKVQCYMMADMLNLKKWVGERGGVVD